MTTPKEADWLPRAKAEMKRQRLSYRQLAQRMNCSHGRVAKFLGGLGRYYEPFVRDMAVALNVPALWLLEGVNPTDQSCPVLDATTVADWLSLSGNTLPLQTSQGLICPALLSPGRRTFAWIQTTDELHDGAGGWMEGDYLYIDPDQRVRIEKSPIVLAKVKKGYLVRKLREIGGEWWLVPGNQVYDPWPVEGEVRIVGVVIGGLRSAHYDL